ncbi:MAG: hypothetical protein IKX85_03370, partial [Clostridia bacterium]|nr:hypothetical protein [Clostridia bacterium]
TARLWRSGQEKAAEARFRDAREGFEAGRCFLDLLVHREELSRAEEKFAAVGEAIADGGNDVWEELAVLDKILEEIAESDRLTLGRVF